MPVHRGRRPERRTVKRRIRRRLKRATWRLLGFLGCCIFRFYLVIMQFGPACWRLLDRQHTTGSPDSACDRGSLRTSSLILPRSSDRPCLVESLLSCKPASEQELVSRTLEALQAWAAQIVVPEHEIVKLEDCLKQQFSVETRSQTAVDSCLVGCAVCALIALDDQQAAKSLSHQLGLVTRTMVEWMLPPAMKTKRKTGAEFDRMLQVIGAIRMLLHTRWQALSGRKRQQWARQRLQCAHPDFAAAVFHQGTLTESARRACSHFLAIQLDCANLGSREDGLLYALCSPRHAYLGSTGCARRVWRCTMSVAMLRFYEHLHEIRMARCRVSHAKHLRKTRLFEQLHLGDLCIWVLCVTRLPAARALETCFLRVGSWPANSQGTQTSVQKPRRRSSASRCTARRAPPRFRSRLVPQHMHEQHVGHVVGCATKLLKRSVSMHQTHVDMAYLQLAFGLPFVDAYWHVYRHRLALDGTYGPLDLRACYCEPLVARYVCEPGSVCWDSIRQRWVLQGEPPGCEAIVAMFALSKQPSSCMRARGMRVCNQWLRLHKLPTSHKRRVLWPEQIPRRIFDGCMRDVRYQLVRVCSPLLAKWFIHTAQAVRPRAPHTQRCGTMCVSASICVTRAGLACELLNFS